MTTPAGTRARSRIIDRSQAVAASPSSPSRRYATGARAARRASHLTRPTRDYRPVPPTPALRCSTDMKLDASWYADKEWRGFVLHDARRDLEDRRVFVTWVAGISHFPAAVDRPDFAPGNEVVLRSEPDNPFDPNAIGVWNASGTVQVGYLPAVIAHDLPRLSEERHGLMVGEMVQGTDRICLWVVVAREPVTLRVVSKVGELPTRSVETWVRHAKSELHDSEEWKALRFVDPLEQMRRMAAVLKQSA
jgi:HIRAN domain